MNQSSAGYSAAMEWRSALRAAPLWTNLAIEDLRDRYRRTLLGVLWVVVSFALFVGVKIVVFGQLSGASTAEFGLYVTIGFGLWSYIISMVSDGSTAYTQARPWIQGTATAYPVYLLQAILRNWLIFGMTMVVMAIGLVWKHTPWTAAMLWSLPGLLTYLLTSLWLVCVLAPLCTRFRDVHQIIQNIMRVLFFATPILWMPASNPTLAAIAQWNPASHFIAVVRDPLLYNTLPADSWYVVLAINLLGIPLGWLVYSRTRPNIIFWV